ncbi:Polysaccharide biosynthesis protein [Rubripirellula obstinata]|uniref:Polysaccharide biosynthesis protein n=1 Tax=Rubripirellula obstinata TaxID=406547 RepID=A0A5B1CJV4_9BACT|nr:hypothetical protein [Rubripirellula obstinata]KAA1259810.1 Polysaccharide biosynthesis protein [Rubripirellula obstinata]
MNLFSSIAIGVVITPFLIAQLGVDGFGLFATIGASGFLFGIFTTTISQSISRELSFSLGQQKSDLLSRVFSTIFTVQQLVAIVFCGAFFLSVPRILDTIQIPTGWELACEICLYIQVAKFGLAICTSPFRSLFYAHQQHGFLAITGIFTSFVRLLALVAVVFIEGNPLLVYVSSVFFFSLPVDMATILFARKRFPETRYEFSNFDTKILKSILNYGASSFLLTMSYQIRNQGLILFFNVFFGNAVAAAQGISNRVNNVIRSGCQVFANSLQPAITSSAGADDSLLTFRLSNLNSAISSVVAITLVTPFLVDAEAILRIWLGEYPVLAPTFIRIVCLTIVTTQISIGQAAAMHAHGRIGLYVAITQLAILVPFLASMGFVYFKSLSAAYVLFGELVGIVVVALSLQIIWPQVQFSFPTKLWLTDVVFPVLLMIVVTTFLSLVLSIAVPSGLARASTLGICVTLVGALIILRTVFSLDERAKFLEIISRIAKSSN